MRNNFRHHSADDDSGSSHGLCARRRSGPLRPLRVVLALLVILPVAVSWVPAVVASPSEWRSFQTDRFIVHHLVSDLPANDPRALQSARLARRVGLTAESVLEKMLVVLPVDLPDPIHIVIDTQLGINAVAGAEPQWAVIHLPAQPGPEFLAGGQGDWLLEALAHEIAHLVLSFSGGALPPGTAGLVELQLGNRAIEAPVTGDGPRVGAGVGLRVPIADSAPFFWVEGAAEFLAQVAGANAWGPGRDMLLRTALLEDLILRPPELESSLGKIGMDGDRAYNQGYAFLRFLHERYGERSFGRIVRAGGKMLRWQWTNAIEDGQGIEFEVLYARWLEWLEQQYSSYRSLRGKEVAGVALSMTVSPWRSPDLEARRRWMAMPVKDRRAEREGAGLVAAQPVWSPDGRYLATWEQGLVVRALPEPMWPAFGGRYLEAVRDRLELARRERRQAALPGVLQYPVSFSPDGNRLVVVARDDWQPDVRSAGSSPLTALFLLDVVENAARQLSLTPVPPGTAVPNTLGGADPAWSPNGRWLSFVRYVDGTGNLWIVRPDGTEPRALTRFVDGTSLGHPSWSPDSSQIVFQMFRHDQRDLWTIDVDRGLLLPVMLDTADDRHPHWAYDGKIYFSSDTNGIFDLYSYDPSTLEVRRLTEAIGGAFMPFVSELDNITFVYFDGYSYRLRGLSALSRLDIPVDNSAYLVDATLARGVLQGAEESPAAEGARYRALRGSSRAVVTPGLRLTDRNVEGGGWIRWRDPFERHRLLLEVLVGMGGTLHARYTFAGRGPTFDLGAWGHALESSVVLEEPDGMRSELRRRQQWGTGYSQLAIPLSTRMNVAFSFDARELRFRDGEAGLALESLHRSMGGAATFVFSTFSSSPSHGVRGIDPRDGARWRIRYSARQSRVRDPLTGGMIYEVGDYLSVYAFHRLDLEWRQAVGIPKVRHTLEWRLNLGYISRNVAYWDELKAGGLLQPLSLELEPFVAFPGYDGSSLSGETLGVLGLAYRVPVARHLGRTWGPVYFDSIYAQLGAVAGNVWGYRPDGDGGPRRESAFVEGSARNTPEGAPQQRILGEVGIELRVQASLFARFRWGSFLHVGYAFQSVTGLGDVNQDGVFPGEYGDVSPIAGDEVFPAGVRVLAGVGTGF